MRIIILVLALLSITTTAKSKLPVYEGYCFLSTSPMGRESTIVTNDVYVKLADKEKKTVFTRDGFDYVVSFSNTDMGLLHGYWPELTLNMIKDGQLHASALGPVSYQSGSEVDLNPAPPLLSLVCRTDNYNDWACKGSPFKPKK